MRKLYISMLLLCVFNLSSFAWIFSQNPVTIKNVIAYNADASKVIIFTLSDNRNIHLNMSNGGDKNTYALLLTLYTLQKSFNYVTYDTQELIGGSYNTYRLHRIHTIH